VHTPVKRCQYIPSYFSFYRLRALILVGETTDGRQLDNRFRNGKFWSAFNIVYYYWAVYCLLHTANGLGTCRRTPKIWRIMRARTGGGCPFNFIFQVWVNFVDYILMVKHYCIYMCWEFKYLYVLQSIQGCVLGGHAVNFHVLFEV
jgi:hypothetical protein